MGNVYRVGSIYGSVYLNTWKEADRCKPGGEEPESVERLDAAEECTRLMKDADDAERTINHLRMLLEDLWDVCPLKMIETTVAGRRANKFIMGAGREEATSEPGRGPGLTSGPKQEIEP